MSHQIFKYSLENQEVVNFHADELTDSPTFCELFHHLFPRDKYSPQLVSFLDFVAERFILPEEFPIYDLIKNRTTELFQLAGIENVHNPDNTHVFHFWQYLFQMFWYCQLTKASTETETYDDQIFSFMTQYDINTVRVALVGRDPTEKCASSGLAFHGSTCYSTKKLFELLNDELTLVDEFLEGVPLKLSPDEVQINKENCDLTGWIQQGKIQIHYNIFLVNCFLTYECHEWSILTDMIVQYLNEREHNMVFIFTGREASEKAALVDKNKHLVLTVYHPSFYSHSNCEENPSYSWRWNLPFINTVFYLYQCYRNCVDDNSESNIYDHLIDWNSCSEEQPGKPQRLDKLVELFDKALSFQENDYNYCIEQYGSFYNLCGELGSTDRQKTLELYKMPNGKLILKNKLITPFNP